MNQNRTIGPIIDPSSIARVSSKENVRLEFKKALSYPKNVVGLKCDLGIAYSNLEPMKAFFVIKGNQPNKVLILKDIGGIYYIEDEIEGIEMQQFHNKVEVPLFAQLEKKYVDRYVGKYTKYVFLIMVLQFKELYSESRNHCRS